MPDQEAWATPGVRLPESPPVPAAEPVSARPIVIDRGELLAGDIPLRPLGVAEMLDAAIAGIRRNPRAVLGTSLIISTVVQVTLTLGTYFLIGDQASGEITPTGLLRLLGAQSLLTVAGLIFTATGVLLLSGLLAPVLGRTLFGLPGTFRLMRDDTRSSRFRLAGIVIVVMLVTLGGGLLPIVPFALVGLANGPAGLGVLFGIIGFPLGLVLMVWLYVLYVLAAPALVLERATIPQALRRARQLMRRRWWSICGTLLLTVLITFFMGLIALRVPFAVAQVVFFGQHPAGAAQVGSIAVDLAGRILSWTMTMPLDAGVIALLYIDLRMRREGLDLELQTREHQESDFMDLWRPDPRLVRARAGAPAGPPLMQR